MAENEAPLSSDPPDPLHLLERAGYASLFGDVLVVVAVVAALLGEDEVFSERVAFLLSADSSSQIPPATGSH
ncbi:hypothetical protein [Synechococcus sp. MW101C3]|uniref:hypothetical protein n=1 Tax=Synechococcus sp. MW101C3 TaxID=210768 RepID=UPI00118183A5|nr:hypothetical protein [Synechococcus sp. MW101C3]